jgi:uncharacterized repeat protein (TIGR03803 family)
MKICIKKSFVVPMLVIGLASGLPLAAETFQTLHDFPQWVGPFGGPYINSDGAKPAVALILSGGTLYGTTTFAGSSGNGTLFALNTDGTDFTVLYNFGDSDGAGAYGSLILSGHTLYGTRTAGGSSGSGTVFSVNTNGTGFTILHAFTGEDDGANPGVGLVLLSNVLYGTTSAGGSPYSGTVFAVNTDGTHFTILHSFTAFDPDTYTNTDGANPSGGLTSSGNILYGAACHGGSGANGTLFKVNVDGTGFTTLHTFTSGNLNSDGHDPCAGLTLSGNVLYGMALLGGSLGQGTLFAVNLDGTGFRTLHNFSYGSDGRRPNVTPLVSGSTLYGVCEWGGGSGDNGTVFAINTDGTGFTILHAFTGEDDGANPSAALIIAGNNLYGPALGGGGANKGTLYRISLDTVTPPQLTITPSAPNVILAWPTNYTGFTLQAATDLSSPMWTTNLPAPVVVNGVNTVTNPVSGTQQFFRLSQ